MKYYIVVQAETIEELENSVRDRLLEGYTPQGGVSGVLVQYTTIGGIVEHREQFYLQAMILEDP